ncbi:MAG: hypothetical protein FJ087_23270, partial [Deltaproteobacteria bacterium]|nr:hypothetical protein [Deltaproteobacteria bacterium]
MPGTSACNWLDDDCDGQTDEEFTSEDGRYTDLHNCGGCGRDCEGSIPYAKTLVCDATSEIPACRATACAPGYEVNPSGICLPPLTNLCAPCASDDDCGGAADRCVELPDGRFCGRDCSPLAVGGQCPAEYDCRDLGAGVRQCVPASGSCTCNSATQGAKRACARENDAGTCYGSEQCDPAAGWVGCTAAVPAPETCNGKDDNCDSLVDEAFPALGSPCSDGTGECLRTGKLSCRADGTGLACDATAAAPGTELCNAKDDDCDGLADEDWPEVGRPCTAGTGACTELGTWGCRDDALGPECDAVPGQGGPESCNYQDDDCDGATDEDWTEGGRYVAHVACGNCFSDCRAIWWSAAHHANGVCDAGPATPVCTYECDSGWADADLNPVNGCELWVDPSAVFVATPDNGGTSALDCGAWNRPCSTIGRGIDQAVASWKARVLVSEGMYAENVVIANGVSVLGGHNAVTWQRDPYTNLTIIQGSTADPLVRDKVAVKAQSIAKATELSGFTIYGENNFWYQKGARGGTSHAVMLVDCGSALVVRDNRVIAGRGSAGSDGTNGATGTNGLGGKPGANCKSAGTNQCSGVTNAGGAGATT